MFSCWAADLPMAMTFCPAAGEIPARVPPISVRSRYLPVILMRAENPYVEICPRQKPKTRLAQNTP